MYFIMNNDLKVQFDALCDEFGMSTNTAFNIFARAVVQKRIFNPDNVVYRKEDKIRQTLRDLDPTRLTPIEAMNILYELKQKCQEEDIGQN